MKRTLLTAALAAGLAVGALGAAPPAEARTSTNYWQQAAPVDRYVPNQAAVAKEVLRLVNIERARVGAPPLRQIAALDGVAQRWANRMVATTGYRHNPDF
ncbi:MAG: hypothetical protein Q4F67_17650, partial [Propionibacteriaceae bacterium]|nr:hypothetical protein [Propionibacteriaceae bacterium]